MKNKFLMLTLLFGFGMVPSIPVQAVVNKVNNEEIVSMIEDIFRIANGFCLLGLLGSSFSLSYNINKFKKCDSECQTCCEGHLREICASFKYLIEFVSLTLAVNLMKPRVIEYVKLVFKMAS